MQPGVQTHLLRSLAYLLRQGTLPNPVCPSKAFSQTHRRGSLTTGWLDFAKKPHFHYFPEGLGPLSEKHPSQSP